MSAARIGIKRTATLLRSANASSAFSTNRHGVSGLLSDPAAASASSSGPFLYNNRRGQVLHISQFVEANGKLPFLVDTPVLVKRMEAQEVPPKQAAVIAEVLKDSTSQLFAWMGEIEKEHLFSIVQRETEKLRDHNEKMHIELRSEIRAANENFRGATMKMLSEFHVDTKKMLSELRVDTQKMLSDFRVGNEKLHSERVEVEKFASDPRNTYGELRVALEKMSSESRKMYPELRVLLKEAEFTALIHFIGIVASVAGVGLFAVIRIMM